MCKTQRGVAAVLLAWLGAAARNEAATHPAASSAGAILLTMSHLPVARKHVGSIKARMPTGPKDNPGIGQPSGLIMGSQPRWPGPEPNGGQRASSGRKPPMLS